MEILCKKALGQGAVTLALFNCFNLAFSTGVHWKYSIFTNNFSLVSSIFNIVTWAIIIMIVISFMLSNPKNHIFGEFKQKFKNC